MIVLSCSAPQTVCAGESVRFDTDVMVTGRSASHRQNGCTVALKERGLYEVLFRANVSGCESTLPTLAIAYGGEALTETVMQTAIRSASDEHGIAAATVVRNSFGCSEKVSVVNIGDAEADVLHPCLVIKHL